MCVHCANKYYKRLVNGHGYKVINIEDYGTKRKHRSDIQERQKTSENMPEYKGKLNWKGEEIEIALWVKDGKNGKFFSAKLSEPFKKEESVFDVPF